VEAAVEEPAPNWKPEVGVPDDLVGHIQDYTKEKYRQQT
jgi:hypothetical protein